MKDKYDLIGKKIGRLTPMEFLGVVEVGTERRASYLCSCECGNEKIVTAKNLKSERVKSCGCIRSASSEAQERVRAQKRQDSLRRKEERGSILKDLEYTTPTPYKDLFDDLKIIKDHWRLKIDFGVLIAAARKVKESGKETENGL